KKFKFALFTVALTALYSCSDGRNEKDNTVGPNGEPPKHLQKSYTKEFIVEEKNYVKALGLIHAFSVENAFYPKYNQCFNDVLDIKVIANIDKYNSTFPCIALQAEKGAPAKAYLTSRITKVEFNQLNGDNKLTLSIDIYGLESIATAFKTKIEFELVNLYKANVKN
ncbi:MAG: hypothetical protein KZQ75_15495, partial [Candidatus Thiodiazotropha sp. (ex Myrtea spinifera)]|nr:hypothetical protein [Candidatus Thiodiazotropha sp. (ex Myrtea spinifera)]